MSGASVSNESTLLRLLVTRSHLQQYESFVARFEEAARSLAEQDREPRLASATVGKRQYERWLSGKLIRQPHPDSCRILEYMFGYSVGELFSPADATTLDATVPAAAFPGPSAIAPRTAADSTPPAVVTVPHAVGAGASGPTADDMGRRMALRGLLDGVGTQLTAPALEAIESVRRSMDIALSEDAGLDMLDEWEHRADDYTRAYLVAPPANLLKDALLDFTDVQTVLKQGQYGRQGSRLWRLLAQLAGMVGLCLYVLAQHRDARAWYHTGRRAAEMCEDRGLQAWMYVRAAGVSLHYSTPASALELADHAAALHRGPSPATARAHVIRSRALARMNDRTNARRALDQGRASFASLNEQATSDKAFGYTERQLLAQSANALTTLRDTKAAQRLREQAFAGFAAHGPSEHLDPMLARLDEGMCLLWESDPTAACRHVTAALRALPNGHRIGLIRVYAVAFANALTTGQQVLPAAAELNECLRAVFADVPAA